MLVRNHLLKLFSLINDYDDDNIILIILIIMIMIIITKIALTWNQPLVVPSMQWAAQTMCKLRHDANHKGVRDDDDSDVDDNNSVNKTDNNNVDKADNNGNDSDDDDTYQQLWLRICASGVAKCRGT